MTSVPVKKTLTTLLRDPGNATCADCKTQSHPRWASWSLGVFVCIKCAGVHRSLGTHISKVKSVDLDTWKEENLRELVRMRNNQCANMIYEAKVPETSKFRDRNLANDTNLLQEFIRQKYERKRWMDTSVDVSAVPAVPVSAAVASTVASAAASAAASTASLPHSSSSSSSLSSAVSSRNHSPERSNSILNLQTTATAERAKAKAQAQPRREQRNELKKSILSLYSAPAQAQAQARARESPFPLPSQHQPSAQNPSTLSIDDDELFKNVWS